MASEVPIVDDKKNVIPVTDKIGGPYVPPRPIEDLGPRTLTTMGTAPAYVRGTGADYIPEREQALRYETFNNPYRNQTQDISTVWDALNHARLQGKFTEYGDQRERAMAYYNSLTGGTVGASSKAGLDASKIPQSGDLAQLAEQFGTSQGEIIKLRQQASGGISGQNGAAGKFENDSFAERSSLPTTGTGTPADSYWDDGRGVQVNAPFGKHFELYAGGGVKTVDGAAPAGSGAPASSLFTQGTDANGATPGFKQESLAYKPIDGKTIAETGQTMFNPLTKVDEYAGEGEVLIKYTDGTVERRKNGGTPGEAVDASKFGRTPEELGLNPDGSQKLGKNTDPNAEQGGNGLAMSSDLEVIGTEYTAANGDKRKAPKGQVFMQDPKTKKILLRPESQAQYGQESTSPSVKAAQAQKEKTRLDTKLASHGFSDEKVLAESFQANPIASWSDLYTKAITDLGATTLMQDIAGRKKQIDDLGKEYSSELENINENPYLSEALRSKKTALATDKFEKRKELLVAQMTIDQNDLQDARKYANDLASNTLTQYNKDREFQMDELKFAADRADSKLDAQIKLQQLSYNEKESAADRAYKEKQFSQGVSEFNTKLSEDQRQFDAKYALDKQQEARIASNSGGGSSGNSSVEQYAQDVFNGSLNLTSVPIKIRSQVSSEVSKLQAGRYDSEFEARVDYDSQMNQLRSELSGGEPLAIPPSEVISSLTRRYGKYISEQEIEATILSLVR